MTASTPAPAHNPYPHAIIALDGPAASGKSTVAKALAKAIGFSYVNTGAMYRAMTWLTLQQNISPEDTAAITSLAADTTIECGLRDNSSYILLNGIDPTPFLRDKTINHHVSRIATNPAIRTTLVACQRKLIDTGGLVMEGRDIGSVVFPDTPYKFYIDASPEVRQQRRAAEGLHDTVAERDRQDSSRTNSPLVISGDANVIDSSYLTIDQVVSTITSRLQAQGLDW